MQPLILLFKDISRFLIPYSHFFAVIIYIIITKNIAYHIMERMVMGNSKNYIQV